jgi:hypothetical protein
VEYQVVCSGVVGQDRASSIDDRHTHVEIPKPAQAGRYDVTATLQYRKVDQFLVNYLLGKDAGITAPVVEIGRATATLTVPSGNGAAGTPAVLTSR